MSGLSWHVKEGQSLNPCKLAARHPLLAGPEERWPCEVLHAPEASRVPPAGGRDLLVGVGTRQPTRLTADMLRLDELIWPAPAAAPPPRVQLFVRAAAFVHLVLRGARRLALAGAIRRIDFDLQPWGLQSMSTTPGGLMGLLDAAGFGVYQDEGSLLVPLNTSSAHALCECEGGLLPTRLQARLQTGYNRRDIEHEDVSHSYLDRCCWIPPSRGRGTAWSWEVCCAPRAVPPEKCRERLRRGRSLRSCCGPRSPLASLARFKAVMTPKLDRRLRSAVYNVSHSVAALYERHGVALSSRYAGSRGRDGARALDGVGEFGISLADVELFLWLRDGPLAAGSRTSWSRFPIFVLGNAFGYSTVVLAKLFPGAAIDVLDAEIGAGVRDIGSPITRRISKEEGFDVHLRAGFSPEATRQAARGAAYGLAFLDGDHTAQQLFLDFEGIRPLLAPRAVVVCHDIALHRMHEAVRDILLADVGSGFSYRIYPSRNFLNEQGTGFFYRGFSEDEFPRV